MSEVQELTRPRALDAIRLGIRSVKGNAVAGMEITESTGLWAGVDPEYPCLYFDSLDLLELVVFLEEEFGWEIAEDQIDAEGWRTVGDLATVVIGVAGG